MSQFPPKSHKLVLTTFVLWVLFLSLFGMPGCPDDEFHGMIRSAFIGYYFLFAAFLLSSSRILAHTLFAAFRPPPPLPSPPMITESPSVAVLYCTRNDVYEPGIASCLSLNYTNHHTYILDDSDDPTHQERVDRIVREHKDRLTLLRRPPPRLDHKAGNLNHALHLLHEEYDYFVVVDSDNLLPSDFLTRLLPYFDINEKIGFVTCNHTIHADAGGRLLPDQEHPDSTYPDPFRFLKNAYGFVPFHGHNGIIKTSVWREAGGFPPLIAEDISFALKARSLGYIGVFVPDFHCRDSMPGTLDSLWVRHARWLRGNWQFLFRFFPRYALHRGIPTVEKIDSVLSALTFIIPWPFMILSLFAMTDIMDFVIGLSRPTAPVGELYHYLGFTGLGMMGVVALEMSLLGISFFGRGIGLGPLNAVYLQLLFYPKIVLEYARAILSKSSPGWTTSGEMKPRVLRETALNLLVGLIIIIAGSIARSPLLLLMGAVSLATSLFGYDHRDRHPSFLMYASLAGMAFVSLRFFYRIFGTYLLL